MTDVDHLSDRMPDVASGRVRWSADDERHLAVCEACRHEWALVRQVARLGLGRAAELDETAIAAAVLDRLRVAPEGASHVTSRRQVWRIAGLAGAGIAALAAGIFLMVREPASSHQMPVTVAGRESTLASEPIETGMRELPIPELEDVPSDALGTVLQVLDRPFQADELLDSNWSDTDSREFEPGFGTISTPEG